eukprot:443156_1
MGNQIKILVKEKTEYGQFNVKVRKDATIKILIEKSIEYLEEKHYPKKFQIKEIFVKDSWWAITEWMKYKNGANVDYNGFIKKFVTSCDSLISDGLSIEVQVQYQHKIKDQIINCTFMQQQQTTNPMKCPIYKEMQIDVKFNQEYLSHIENEKHFKNEMEEKPECKFNENCISFKRLELGGHRIDDLCHIQLYRHPPRQRNIKLQENIHSVIFNKDNKENHPVYEPTDDDKKKYSFNDDDGFLKALIEEVVQNGYKYDLCLECEKGEECKHEEYDILQIVDQKMKHQRYLMMGSPLRRDKMLSLILYTGGYANYDLCASQRNGDYKKWKWFDYCLSYAIWNLSRREMGSFPVYSGLQHVQMDKKEIKAGYFVTYTSTSWNKEIATTFMGGNKGMILKIDQTFKNHEDIACCDVSWISKFPHEYEVLFARSTSWRQIFKCKVIENQNDVQTVILSGNNPFKDYQVPFGSLMSKQY